MSDDNDSYERYQIGENNEDILTNDIEVLKLGKLSLQKNIDNIEEESNKSDKIDMIDDKEYNERDQIIDRKENEL